MADENRNNGTTTGRDKSGRFGVGNPGRPRGSRHKTTVAMMALLEGEAEAITRACIEAAKGGDVMAIRLVLERLLPPAKERPIACDLPDVQTAEDVAKAQAAILQGLADGDLLPSEAATLASFVDRARDAHKRAEGEARLEAMLAHHRATR